MHAKCLCLVPCENNSDNRVGFWTGFLLRLISIHILLIIRDVNVHREALIALAWFCLVLLFICFNFLKNCWWKVGFLLFKWYVLFRCSWCLSAEMEQAAEQPVQIQGGSSDGSESDLVSRVRKLLFRRMLIGIKDGRFFLGNFYCIDKQGNIILQDTVEYRSTRRSAPSPMEQRCIGLILIPSSCRTSCHVDFSVDEQLSLLSLNEKWVL